MLANGDEFEDDISNGNFENCLLRNNNNVRW